MHSYTAGRFRDSVDAALKKLRFVLQSTRRPSLPEEVDHTYPDK